MSTPGEKLILSMLSQSVRDLNKQCTTYEDHHANDGTLEITESNNKIDVEKEKCLSFKTQGRKQTNIDTSYINSKLDISKIIPVKIKSKPTFGNITNCDKRVNKKSRKSATVSEYKPFTPEEIRSLLKAMEEHGDKVNIKEFAKEFGRKTSTVRQKIMTLKVGESLSRKTFSFIEDKIIMDTALKNLKSGHKFKFMSTISISELVQLSLNLKRSHYSIRFRWSRNLQPWILQYYSGTLNLQVKQMLVNLLADNYSSLDKVDWSFVTSKPEFAGHTESSLRGLLSMTIGKIKMEVKKESPDLLLVKQYIDIKFNEGRVRKVSDKVKTRQLEVEKYFQEFVNRNKLRDIF